MIGAIREDILFALELIRKRKNCKNKSRRTSTPKVKPKPMEPSYTLKMARLLNTFLKRFEKKKTTKTITLRMIRALHQYIEGFRFSYIECLTGVKHYKIYELLKFFDIPSISMLSEDRRYELARFLEGFTSKDSKSDRELTQEEVEQLQNGIRQILGNLSRKPVKEYYAEIKRKIIGDLRKGMMTNREIARKYGVSEDYVWKISKEIGVKSLGNTPKIKVRELRCLWKYYCGQDVRGELSRVARIYEVLRHLGLPKKSEIPTEKRLEIGEMILRFLKEYEGVEGDVVLEYAKIKELKEVVGLDIQS